MEKGIKTRICINCEGSMSFEDPFCPYCGQNQEAPPASKEKAFSPPFKLVQPTKAENTIPAPLYKPQEAKAQAPDSLYKAQDSLYKDPSFKAQDSLYKDPSFKAQDSLYKDPSFKAQDLKNDSPFKSQDLQSQVNSISKSSNQPSINDPEPLTQNAKMRSFLLALILTMCGSTFLLFGLCLFLFGKEGLLTVHWKSSHWYLYLTLSLPLLFFGWRYSNVLNQES